MPVSSRDVDAIAASLSLSEAEYEPCSSATGKVVLENVMARERRPGALYVDVTAMTPTPFGEGKTVTTVGLSMGFRKLGKNAVSCIRQPSLGPLFGLKGPSGGGACRVLPEDDFSLHLTGDAHAVSMAQNLLAAFADNHIARGNELGLVPDAITLPRVIDINDRALREVLVGVGDKAAGFPRRSRFEISASSEVMAVLALAGSMVDLRKRLGRIVVGPARDGSFKTAEDLRAAGAMAALLMRAVRPNLCETAERTPVFVHAGPFANLAHGNSSVLADHVALRVADVVVTESGFGSDLGFEKFVDIKCRASGLRPDAAAVVVTLRALKMHGIGRTFRSGAGVPDECVRENREALDAGFANLKRHLSIVERAGVPSAVIVNRFPQDTDAEIAYVKEKAVEFGAGASAESRAFAEGGAGAAAAAEAVLAAAEAGRRRGLSFRPLYDLEAPLASKVTTLATSLYGAGSVTFSDAARESLARFEAAGFGKLPVCVAKTPLSFSGSPLLLNAPIGFDLAVTDARLYAGAGFVTVLVGEINSMPALPTRPRGEKIDVDADGRVVGLL